MDGSGKVHAKPQADLHFLSHYVLLPLDRRRRSPSLHYKSDCHRVVSGRLDNKSLPLWRLLW